MQIGMIGLGRMGANLVRRLIRAGHECVVYDRSSEASDALATEGARATRSLEDLAKELGRPRTVWMMVPAGAVDTLIDQLAPLLEPGDILIDGGNSNFRDDIQRAKKLAAQGLHYLDVGTSGGVWGLERGYCLMIGGEGETVRRLEPIFAALAPGEAAAPALPERAQRGGTAGRGYLHCGAHGAGHFVKMVHNGIEYGLMAAYAEGFNILRHANAGAAGREGSAEVAPLRDSEVYRYEFELADVAELWRRGSVVTSWLLDLTAAALADDPRLERYGGRVSDSGEGRWTLQAAIDVGVPAHVLSAAVYERFASRGHDEFANKVLSAMRERFGGHREESSQ